MIRVDPFNCNNYLLREIREQAADGLGRSANHFRDFFTRERQFHMRRLVAVVHIGRPGEQ